MPRPVLIVCAESGAVDKLTNRLSVFDIVEKVLFQRIENQPPGSILPKFKMQVVAIWMRQDDESDDDQFESEFAIVTSGSQQEASVVKMEFSFEPGKQLFRGIALLDAPLPIDGAGRMEILNRVRKVGDADWITQSYPILVEEVVQPTAAVNSEVAAAR
jgi:hypothetical protein